MTVAPVAAAPLAPAGASNAPRASFAARLQAHGPVPPTAAGGAQAAISALAAVDRAGARLEAVLAAARAGRTFTAAELLGLQAQAYRCAQTVDLAAKVAEQGAQCVKQALHTQL